MFGIYEQNPAKRLKSNLINIIVLLLFSSCRVAVHIYLFLNPIVLYVLNCNI